MPPWLSLLYLILEKNIQFGIMVFLEVHEINEMILGSRARGGRGLLYHDELLVFPQNASP